jgi:hypothetical protein
MDKKVKIFDHVLFSWIKKPTFLSTLKLHAQRSSNSCPREFEMHKKWRFVVHDISICLKFGQLLCTYKRLEIWN